MKKILFPVLCVATLGIASYASSYMHVHLLNGNVFDFELENVTEVIFLDDSVNVNPPVDTTSIINPVDTANVINPVDTTLFDTTKVVHDYVDLGLPSGTLWATYNIGATSPEEFGYYFSWGETEPKSEYYENTYKWYSQYDKDYSKYNELDKLPTLLPEDDAATVNWGPDWRMPTIEEFNELICYCNSKRVKINGVAGVNFKGDNGESVFFPFTGYHIDSDFVDENNGLYWASTSDDVAACGMEISEFLQNTRCNYYRWDGFTVRPVRANTTPIVDPKDTIKPIDTPTDTTVIIVPDSSKYVKFSTTGEEAGHSYVDLGLESGTMWATYNIGAIDPTEYGDYYAWGETQTKKVYDWSTYKWSNDDTETSFTKYCNLSSYGEEDNKLYLEASDDVTTVKWGYDWRMPTMKEQEELVYACTWEWYDNINGTGISGVVGTSLKNGNTIFFPASGYYDGSEHIKSSSNCIWASDIEPTRPSIAGVLYFPGRNVSVDRSHRKYGRTVRAVFNRDQFDNKNGYVDLGLPSGILWGTRNLGASTASDFGDYYSWGETESKDFFSWDNYKLVRPGSYKMTKYCEKDSLMSLLPEDDAVTAKLGSDWRMPTSEEFDELIENCQSIWCLHNGVFGRKFIGKNGNMIFLPASGFISGDESYFKQESAYYFSSSLQDFDFAYILNFNNRGIEKNISSLVSGYTIRGVRKK